MNEKNFLSIMQSVDAFFPIGAFTLSNGLEDYVVREDLKSSRDLEEYMKGFLELFPYQDLGILSLAYKYYKVPEKILLLDELTEAMKGASEVRIGSSRMCSRYLKVRSAMQDVPQMLLWYEKEIRDKHAAGFHPIALGIYGASVEIEEETLLVMYAYSVVSAIANNTVKLVPLSQMEGQRVLYQNMEHLINAVNQAKKVRIEEIGVSGGLYEIHCMNHERLYSRQYIS